MANNGGPGLLHVPLHHRHTPWLCCTVAAAGQLGQFIFRMSEFTVRTLRTKARHVTLARNLPHMFVLTPSPMLAESTRIPRAFLEFVLGADVSVHELGITAFPEIRKEMALGHLVHSKFVQEFTMVVFLAQRSQPMFAYDCFVSFRVAKRALCTAHARSLLKILTYFIRPWFVLVREALLQRKGVRVP